MALSPRDVELHIAAQTRQFVEELETEIDRQLLHIFKSGTKETVRIAVTPAKFYYQSTGRELVAKYSDVWIVETYTPENGYNVYLDFTPK